MKRGIGRQPMGIVAVAEDAMDCKFSFLRCLDIVIAFGLGTQHLCQQNNGGCHQTCSTDERGAVKCSCEEGFELADPTNHMSYCQRMCPVRPSY
jgi:hypothetical protein